MIQQRVMQKNGEYSRYAEIIHLRENINKEKQ